ncbi:LysR family transcriptional regulator [Jeotgalicoccus halotolerans]|jgi:Transcriptional regulator|uniref:LysR family transcriptional regulator n=1 Tax=Jeotgalicoccus nanhaiensis TaxID=568603 RepID=A0ABR9XXZ2_9STAP|nr:LysR family transcriptional regulator [Jeotgalicoccus nanhaiensis]MBF0753841.1 LysR family transcriptional regulator [Jeotgalicoccus nanhaiensis]TFU62003.1 LysR family transcriptional regulator [Jeotgalicoccus nanhaiensis]
MDIKQLRYFHEIVKHGKVSRAANSLYVSQPSLSMSLSKLENEIGFKLLERNDGTFKLTDAGAEFYKHVKLVLSIFENMEDEVEYIGKRGSGQLKMGITELFRAVIPELFDIFLESNNNFDIKLTEGTTSHIIDQLRMHQLHFGLTTLSYLDEDMESIYLGPNLHSLLVHRDIPLSELNNVSLQNYQNHTLIFSEGSYELNEFLHKNNLKFRNVIRVDTIGTAVRLVKKGLGIAVMPELYASNYTDDDVTSVSLDYDLKGPDLYLSYMKNRYFTSDIEKFINVTKEYLEN